MKVFFIAATLAILVPATSLGQTMGHSKMMHGNQAGMMMDGMLPQETGQSAFAAIQEIVAMLNANPATDWSKVDIEALRQHLIDGAIGRFIDQFACCYKPVNHGAQGPHCSFFAEASW